MFFAWSNYHGGQLLSGTWTGKLAVQVNACSQCFLRRVVKRAAAALQCACVPDNCVPGALKLHTVAQQSSPFTLVIEETGGAFAACSTLPFPCALDKYAQEALGIGSARPLPAHMHRCALCSMDAVAWQCMAASWKVQGGVATPSAPVMPAATLAAYASHSVACTRLLWLSFWMLSADVYSNMPAKQNVSQRSCSAHA